MSVERYRDALARGHAALARGQLTAALAAYREAAAFAPDRALPQAAIGQVLLREKAFADAVAAFDAALARGPRDETILRGRAEALAGLGRRTDAADTLDVLSEVQERAGRLADAWQTTGRALELAEQKARRRRLQELTRRVRLADQPDASLHVQEHHALGEVAPVSPAPAPADAVVAPLERRGEEAPAEVGAAVETPEPPTAQTEPETHPIAKTVPDVGMPEPEPEPPASAPPAPDPVALIADAEAALDAGDLDEARRSYLAAAAAFEHDGLVHAALDACYQALAFAPDDPDVHLRLVELYVDVGWNEPAADKLALLSRLAALDERKPAVRARIVGLAADHFPDDPRLRRLSAQGAPRS